jgi:hypothetical protein
MHLDQESEKKMVDDAIITPIRVITMPENIEEKDENKTIKTISSDIKQSKWKIVKESNHLILPPSSKGEIKLANIINELKKFSVEEQIQATEKISINNSNNCIKISRQRLLHYLSQPRFHYCIIILVIIDLMVVLVDLVLGMLFK